MLVASLSTLSMGLMLRAQAQLGGLFSLACVVVCNTMSYPDLHLFLLLTLCCFRWLALFRLCYGCRRLLLCKVL